MKDASRTLAGDGTGGRTRQALVIAELALSVVLLMGAGLMIRGFLQLQRLDVGFQADKVLMVGLPTSPKRYATYDQRVAFSERVLAEMANLPGVQSVAIGNGGLPFGGPQSAYSIDGTPKHEPPVIQLSLISAGYTQTLGIPLRAGRILQPQEVAAAEPVALINETAAKLWPAGTSPIGRQIRLGFLEKPPTVLLAPEHRTSAVTVVGIIADTRNAGLSNPPVPAAYIPYTLLAPPTRTLALRTQTKPALLVNALRERLRGIDKEQPLSRPITLAEVVGFETVQPRFNVALFTFFGLLGLVLAIVGIYSTLAYTVSRRTHEIGVRMALGARRGDVLNLILAMGGRLVLIGLAMGLIVSLALVRILRTSVFQVPATDLTALWGVVVLLCGTALLACFVPARRAANLDPMSALRHD